MRHRFAWLNNPYLWLIAVVAGLVGVSNWPTDPNGRLNAQVWDSTRNEASEQLTAFLSQQGWMEPPRAGEATRLRRFRETTPPRSPFSFADSPRPSRNDPMPMSPSRDDRLSAPYPAREDLRP